MRYVKKFWIHVETHNTATYSRFVGLSDSLPKTSNIKMVDVWMLFSLVLPFVDVVLQTYSYLLSQGEDEKEEDKSGTKPGLSRIRVGAIMLAVSTKKKPNRYDEKVGKCVGGSRSTQSFDLTTM
jgi:hypothetical protein